MCLETHISVTEVPNCESQKGVREETAGTPRKNPFFPGAFQDRVGEPVIWLLNVSKKDVVGRPLTAEIIDCTGRNLQGTRSERDLPLGTSSGIYHVAIMKTSLIIGSPFWFAFLLDSPFV